MKIPGFARTAVCAGAVSIAGFAHAADLPAAAPAPSQAPASVFTTWEFNVTGYAWLSAVKGTLATVPPLPPVDVNMTIPDVLKNLGGALMGTFEARYGRFVLFNDLMYTRLIPEANRTKGPFAVSVNIDSYSFIGMSAAGYRVVETPQFIFDVFAGARGFYMDNAISVRIDAFGYSKGDRFEATKTWFDAVGGVRARYEVDDKWFLNLIAFAGGGGSKYQWDVYGGAGYAFNKNWGAFLGYRAFRVNYRDGDFIYDVLQHGPLLGVQYRW
ncbi:MAG: hypothetical protein ACK4MV_20325 [Beijerinckiaceae bacterium]